MKLTETIDKCIFHIEDEIKCYSFEIDWYLKYDQDNIESLSKLRGELKDYQDHLNNLRFIRYETELEELDKVIKYGSK